MVGERELLSVHGLVKAYPGARALAGVDLVLRAGEIHGLAGLNGAGKSTLITILAGLESPTSGSIEIAGHGAVAITNALDAQRLGIAVVHQEVPLLANLTAAENVALGFERTGLLGPARRRAAIRRYEDVAQRLPGAPPATAKLADLSLYAWQIVAVIRAVAMEARILVLDEPTSSLSTAERHALHDLIRELAADGIGILYVSHFLDDMLEASTVITVLRDGRVAYDGPAAGLDTPDLLAQMTGVAAPERPAAAPQAPQDRAILGSSGHGLVVDGLSTQGVRDVSFRAEPGERVGLFGLEGCGSREVIEAIFGLRARHGNVTWNGGDVPAHTRLAIRAGVALVTGDRRRTTFPLWSVALNHSLPNLAQRSLLAPARGRGADVGYEVGEAIARLEIKATADQPMGSLSGGNQQKALIGRWLGRGRQCLLLDDPTRGVDLAGRSAIHEELRALSAHGATLVIRSTDPEEVVELCDRVAVMADGRIVAEVAGAELTASRLEQLTRDRSLHRLAA